MPTVGTRRAATFDSPITSNDEPRARRSAEHLNDVLHMLNDSVEGFVNAAAKLAQPVYADACRRYADERRRLADELRPLVFAGGIEPTAATELRGRLARTWMTVRAALGGGDRAIIESIESAEDRAVEVYREAMASEELEPGARAAVSRQYPLVKAAHDQFSTWKHHFAGSV